MQCFEANNQENTEIIAIENDISLVDTIILLYKLPTSELHIEKGQIISLFSGVVDVFEKHKY